MEAKSQLGVQIRWFTYGIKLLDASGISSLATLLQSMGVFFILVNLLLDLIIVISIFIWGRSEN